MRKTLGTPDAIPPKPRATSTFHIAELKRIMGKIESCPALVTQGDCHAAMTAAAGLKFPDETPVKAYSKFLGTKPGQECRAAYFNSPPSQDVLALQPQPPTAGSAMNKMNTLASALVQKGEVPTHAKGIVEVLKREPNLYRQHLDETP